MKKIYLLIISVLLFLKGQAQEPLSAWELSETISGTKNYVARDSITLKDGFHYVATQGNSFTGQIDERLLFPPSGNTYATQDGTITTNPSIGAVVGTIHGQFNVSPTGAATYTVPIECPAGINGMQPSISLVYSSQSGNGIAGMCWNLAGLSMISRVGKNYYHDNEKSGIIWDNTSPLALDGQRLIKIQEWGNDSIEYRTESGLDKIIAHNLFSSDFKIYSKDGRILEYGNDFGYTYYDNNLYYTSYSSCPLRIKSSGGLISEFSNIGWFLSKVTDTNNNYIKYTYTNTNWKTTGKTYYFGDNRISKIEYGHNNTKVASIHFQYKMKASVSVQYIDSIETKNQYILEYIYIKGVNDEILKTYQLSYNVQNGLNFLSQIKLMDTSGDFIHPLKFNWNPIAYNYEDTPITFNTTPHLTSYNQVESFTPYSYGDIDGDGLTDILVRYSLSSGNPKHYWVVYRNQGNGTFQYLYEESWDKNNENTFLFLDIDNDGKDELYVGRVKHINSLYWYYLDCFRYDISFQRDMSGDKSSTEAFNTSLYNNRNSLYVVPGNFTGKGDCQFIVFPKNCNVDKTLNYGFIPSLQTVPSEFQNGVGSTIMLTDINGNGKTEVAYKNGNTISFYEYQQNGIAYNGTYTGFKKLFSISDDNPISNILTGDFNGDGNTDLLVRHNNSSPYIWKIWISTGTGFVKNNMSNIIDGYNVINSANIAVTDVNQDGKSDIVLKYLNTQWACSPSTTPCMTILKVLINTGNNNFTEVLSHTRSRDATENPLSFSANMKASHGTEIMMAYNIQGGGASKILTLCKDIWFNKISKITDSFGQQLTVAYKDYKNPNLFTQKLNEEKEVINNFLPQLEIVDTIKTTNVNTSYTFAEPEVHRTARGFLGFKTIQAKDNIKSITQTTENKLDNMFYFLYPYKSTLKTNAGSKISETTSVYSVVNQGSKKYFLRQDSLISTDVLKGMTVRTSYSSYDSDRNPQTIKTNFGNGITSTQALTYIKKGSRLINKIASRQITQKATGQPDVIRKEYFFYDNKGNITLQTKDSTDVNKVQTFYGNYDQYGHPQKITTAANGVSRSQTFTYSSSGRFVHTKTNDQTNETVTYNYDESKGLLLNQTDRFGTTSYLYDNWGRLKQTLYPDGIKTASILQWAGTTPGKPVNAKYYSYTETSGQPPVIVWHDALGREIRKDSYGLNKQKVFVDTEYNSKGQLYRMSEPYFENTAKTWAQTFFYDSYGRINNVVTPMGTTTYAYSGLTTTVTAPTDTRETTVNSAGWTISQKVNGKSVAFTHYASGLPKTATPQSGQPLTMEYDLQGNRTKLIDPDAGTIESRFDGWGELTWEKQAVHNSSLITTNYNYLPSGLLNYRSRNGETTSYEYDNLFRLKRVFIAGKHSQAFIYDQWDRIVQTNDTVDGVKAFARKTEYDGLGRVSKEIYPGGFSVSSMYDGYGYLNQVRDMYGNTVWKALESNARGQLTRTQGGGRETVFGFDGRGFPTSIVAAGVTSLSYSFNAKGNLEYRQDNMSGYKESFGYDSMNRLTNWSISQNNATLQSNSIAYNSSTGNIQSKSDLNDYTMNYGSNGKPHALTSISGKPAAIPFGSRTITYTDFKKVETVSEGSNLLSLSYGVGEERIKTVLTKFNSTLTRYYMGNYEEEVSGGNVRRINYISGGNGLAALYIQDQQGGTLYYTHTDYQGSLTALSLASGTVEQYAFDPWGNRRNPSDWTQADSRTSFLFHRGYTMHEHLPEFSLINMNGRVYDPLTSMFFSPDPYLQAPDDWLNYNRYSYVLNNPLKYTDPTGENPIVVAMIIGAAFGAYSGGVIANGGQYNPTKWDFNSGKTWGYMLGGAAIGGASGAFGASIATTGGGFMANTAGIMGSSFMNSVGMNVMTNGQTPVSIGFGFGSYDFTNGKFDYLWKKGNSDLENIGYGLGALANLSDILMGTNPQDVDLVTEHSDNTGHSALVKTGTETGKITVDPVTGKITSMADPNGIISVGPNRITDPTGSWHWMKGTNKWDTHSRAGETIWKHTLKANTSKINKYANWLNNMEKTGTLKYSVELSSCVTHTSFALSYSGIFNIGLHPYLLNAQMALWSNGIRPWTYSYYLTQKY